MHTTKNLKSKFHSFRPLGPLGKKLELTFKIGSARKRKKRRGRIFCCLHLAHTYVVAERRGRQFYSLCLRFFPIFISSSKVTAARFRLESVVESQKYQTKQSKSVGLSVFGNETTLVNFVPSDASSAFFFIFSAFGMVYTIDLYVRSKCAHSVYIT